MTLARRYPPTRLLFDPLKDKSYRRTRLGRSVVDFLAWKRIGGTAERTLDTYERALARGALMFPKVGLDDLTASELLHIADSFTLKQRRTRMAAWSEFLKWAIRYDHLEGPNPFDKLPPLRTPPPKEIVIFTEAEVELLTGLPDPDGLLFQILLEGGLRKGEARSLRVGNFRPDPAPGYWIVLGKGSKERKIPLTIDCSQRLNEVILLDGLKPEDHLWYTSWHTPQARGVNRKTPIGEGTFHRWYYNCLDRAGVRREDHNPHVTRHTFATNYLKNEGAIDRLSVLLGHASIKTTQDFYSHLDTGDLFADFARVFGEG